MTINQTSCDEFNNVLSVLHAQKANWIKQIEHFTTLDSSNDYLMRAQGDIHGRVCVTDFQSQGKGRRGNVWHGDSGDSLLFSLGWHPQNAVSPAVSLVVGLALIEALKLFGIKGLCLKWPNDVLYQQKKLAGILVESSFQADKVIVVIGVGLNLQGGAKRLQKLNAVTLDQVIKLMPSKSALLAKILSALSNRLNQLDTHGFKSMRSVWAQYLAFVNEPVQFVQNGIKQQGILLDVDDYGALLVKTASGIQAINSGELHTLRSRA